MLLDGRDRGRRDLALDLGQEALGDAGPIRELAQGQMASPPDRPDTRPEGEIGDVVVDRGRHHGLKYRFTTPALPLCDNPLTVIAAARTIRRGLECLFSRGRGEEVPVMRSERAPVALCLVVLLAVAGCSSAGSSASTASSAPAATAAATTAPSVAAATTAPTPAPSEIPAADVTGNADRARLARLRPGHLLARLQVDLPEGDRGL